MCSELMEGQKEYKRRLAKLQCKDEANSENELARIKFKVAELLKSRTRPSR